MRITSFIKVINLYPACDKDNTYFLHKGITHERLFFALNQHKHHNVKNLCKKLFPEKFNDNTDLDWKEKSQDEMETRKRKMPVDDRIQENLIKVLKKLTLQEENYRSWLDTDTDESEED